MLREAELSVISGHPTDLLHCLRFQPMFKISMMVAKKESSILWTPASVMSSYSAFSWALFLLVPPLSYRYSPPMLCMANCCESRLFRGKAVEDGK